VTAVRTKALVVGPQFLVRLLRELLAALGAEVRVLSIQVGSEASTGHAIERIKSPMIAWCRNLHHAPLVLLGPLVGIELRKQDGKLRGRLRDGLTGLVPNRRVGVIKGKLYALDASPETVKDYTSAGAFTFGTFHDYPLYLWNTHLLL